MRLRPPTPRELILLSAVAIAAIAMIQRAWITPVRPEAQFFGDVATTAQRLPECHCGSDTLYPPSDRHAYQYEGFSDATLLPAGFESDAFHLYDWRHCRAYVDWWNVDEGLIRSALDLDEGMLRRAGAHMRLSVQNVILGGLHREMVLGPLEDRTAANSLLDLIADVAGSDAAALDTLQSALPHHECYLVIGMDTATGQVVLDFPGIHGEMGVWGGYPLIAIDFHRTGYVYQFGADPITYLTTLWPQINRAAIEARWNEARALHNPTPTLSADSLAPLTDQQREAINLAALDAAPFHFTLDDFDPEALAPHAAELTEMLGSNWPRIQERIAATAPALAVIGERMDTGEIVICQVADPAREGIWGVRPIAVFEPTD